MMLDKRLLPGIAAVLFAGALCPAAAYADIVCNGAVNAYRTDRNGNLWVSQTSVDELTFACNLQNTSDNTKPLGRTCRQMLAMVRDSYDNQTSVTVYWAGTSAGSVCANYGGSPYMYYIMP